MALKPLNSIGGFAVGEGQDIVIDGLQNATLANVDASGNLVVDGLSTFTGDVTAQGNVVVDLGLTVTGASDLTGDVAAHGNVVIDLGLTVGESADFNSSVTAASMYANTSVAVGTTLTVGSWANITGEGVFGANVAITGDVSAANAVFSGNVSGVNAAFTGDANIVGVILGGSANIAGALDVYGTSTLNDALYVTGDGTFSSSLFVTGAEANITNNLVVGGTADVTGNVNAGDLSVSGDGTFGGTLGVTGQATVGSLVVNNDALISGNLTVDGNVVYVNVENLTVEDPLIDLGTGPNGAVLTSNDGKDRGSLLEYYTTAPVTAYSGWKNSAGEFYMASNVAVAADIVTVNSWANVRLDTVLGNVSGGYIALTGGANIGGTANIAGPANISGVLTVSNVANISGNINIGGDANIAGNLNIGGDVQFDDLYATGNLIAAKQVIGNTVQANASMTFGTSITGPTVFANTVVSNVAILADSANAFSSNTAPRVAYTSANVEVAIFTGTTNLNYTFKLVGVDQGNTANRYSVSVDTDWNGDYVVYNTLGTSLGAIGFVADAPNNASYLTVTPNTNNAIAWFNTVTTTTF